MLVQKVIGQDSNVAAWEDMPQSNGLTIKTEKYTLLDGKRKTLIQRVGDGSIIVRFDKTPRPTQKTDVVCPHFLELKWGNGCAFNCAWCYLQGTYRFLPDGT